MSDPLPDPRRWLALVVLLAGAFLPAFDYFVVNVALPSLQTELGARPAQLQFVVAGYALGFAILLVTGGRLGDPVRPQADVHDGHGGLHHRLGAVRPGADAQRA